MVFCSAYFRASIIVETGSINMKQIFVQKINVPGICIFSGKCMCGSCSREKARILRIDEYKLFKVCRTCANELKENRKYREDVFAIDKKL